MTNYEELAQKRLEIIRDQSDIIMDLREELKCTQRKLKLALREKTTIYTRWQADEDMDAWQISKD
jgi:hypothetical protein